MRISGASFARIRDDAGRYVLLVNRGRQRHAGQLVLSPIGGGLLRQCGTEFFTAAFGADHFEAGRDLRFWVPDDNVEKVVEWFQTRKGRERTVRREFLEELTDETGIFTRGQLRTVRYCYVGFRRYRDMTTRNVFDKRTQYLIEVFDVILPGNLMAGLVAAAAEKDPVIYFATEDEIKVGSTNGVKIGGITKLILAA